MWQGKLRRPTILIRIKIQTITVTRGRSDLYRKPCQLPQLNMARLPTLDICPPALLEVTPTPKDGRAGGRSAESLEPKSQSTTGDGNKQQCKPIRWDIKCGG